MRERQDLLARWRTVDKAIIANVSRPLGERNPAMEQALRTELMGLDARIANVDVRLSNEAPEYAVLASTAPRLVAEVQSVLGQQ